MKNKNFNLYLFGKFISLIGSGIQNIALPLYVIKMTESGKIMGLFSVITMIPVLILTPFSGVIGDRLNRKAIMISMDFFRGLLILIMSSLSFNGFMNIYIILFFQIFISMEDRVYLHSKDLNYRIAATSWGNPYEYRMVMYNSYGVNSFTKYNSTGYLSKTICNIVYESIK